MTPTDPYLWLEDVTGEAPLAWVRERNAASEALLKAQPGFAATEAGLRAVLDSQDRIPQIHRIGAHVYNFWTDDAHPRGLWRRTTLADYRNARPRWETVLDVDALGRHENESWVFGGASPLSAATEAGITRCLVHLSRGGADAGVVREFDLSTCGFVDGGFALPEAKGDAEWMDRDTLYVATDFGPDSMTDSGYPRVVKRWQRGTALAEAVTVFEGQPQDVSVSVEVDASSAGRRHFFRRALDFWRTEFFVLQDGRLQRIDKPEDAGFRVRGDLMLVDLHSPWQVGGQRFPAGALLATSFDGYLRGERQFDVLFEPSATRSLAQGGITLTRSRVLIRLLDNVGSRVEELRREGDAWLRRALPLPGLGPAWLNALHDPALADDPLAESVLLGYEDAITPESLYLLDLERDTRELLKQRPPLFDATGMRIEQLFATSRDGTRVPYFVVWPAGATASGDNPTVLYGYGGFRISLQPAYQASRGNAWLARGGVFVVANIRGGGEFGPDWHQAAVRQNKQRSYDDFIAVAEDLLARRITSSRHLGIMGGSNGGLLVGAVMTQRPDLFNAVVCQVPLLDMQRFHKLLAGASWMAEYGDPDRPEDWAFISAYSPYHRIAAETKYPRTLFTTSTRDDRVHPGHARKMVARMQGLGHDVLYYENMEGGHGGAADARQRAHLQALEFSFLWMQLGRRTERPLPAAATGST